jgi:hypothetical protein
MIKVALLSLTLFAFTTVELVFSLEREVYFQNGQLSAKTSYKFGEKDGLHEMYYPDGALFLKANYQAGKRHGIKTLFSPDGRIIETEDWVLGKLSRTSKPKKKKLLATFEPFVCGFGVIKELISSDYDERVKNLLPLAKAQFNRLQEIQSELLVVLRKGRPIIGSIRIQLTKVQAPEVSKLFSFVRTAQSGLVYKPLQKAPKFTDHQIRQINDLLPKEQCNIDELKKLGLLKSKTA